MARGESYLGADIRALIAGEEAAGGRDSLAVLTAREFEIFRLLAEGRSAEEIAQTLFVSAKTIANTTSQIKQKLYVNSPVDLVRLALKCRLVQH